MDDDLHEIENVEDTDEEVLGIMKDYDLEKEEAEEVQELMGELGVDEDDAVEIRDLL